MKQFVQLFEKIDQTQSTNEKISHIKNYFLEASKEDSAWALFFLSGHRLKRLISSKILLSWCAEITHFPLWLIEESYSAVGDTAECIALLLPQRQASNLKDTSLSYWLENLILPLQKLSLDQQKEKILGFWASLNTKEIFVLNKILTGAFRVGVSSLITLKALSEASGIKREFLSQRLMGNWQPTKEFYKTLLSNEQMEDHHNPYPFYLAYAIDDINSLIDLKEWFVEWKWDGIRAQAIVRNDRVTLWSRGNELISSQFPELIDACKTLDNGTVLDGEIIVFKEDKPAPFAELQKRLGRKTISANLLKNNPVIFMVYDVLEYKGEDIRLLSLEKRRQILDELVISTPLIKKSTVLSLDNLGALSDLWNKSKDYFTEGLMIKKRSSSYGVGRQKGYWWKYKVDPMTIDAVLIYAQAGSGIRANLFTDYTFAVWQDKTLVPIAKAYSGLDKAEIKELDQWIRKNTEEKFGPVRKVKAYQVFEIAFEGIQISNRHKSGIALRFPRISRWRKDKPIEECDTLETIKEMYLS